MMIFLMKIRILTALSYNPSFLFCNKSIAKQEFYADKAPSNIQKYNLWDYECYFLRSVVYRTSCSSPVLASPGSKL